MDSRADATPFVMDPTGATCSARRRDPPDWPVFAWVAVRTMLTAYGPDHQRPRVEAITGTRWRSWPLPLETFVFHCYRTLPATLTP